MEGWIIPTIVGLYILAAHSTALPHGFRRVKAEKTLAEIELNSAVGAVQFFLTNEEHTPFNWP